MSDYVCSNEKITAAYYNPDENKDVIEHLKSCKICSDYYNELNNMSEKANLIQNINSSADAFVVKRIVNIYLAKKERKRAIWEAFIFALISFVLLVPTLMVGIKSFLIFYILVFVNLPIFLLPVILKRKDLI